MSQFVLKILLNLKPASSAMPLFNMLAKNLHIYNAFVCARVCVCTHCGSCCLVEWAVGCVTVYLSVCLFVGSQLTHATADRAAADWRVLQLCAERGRILGHRAHLAAELRRRQLHQAHRRHHCVANCATESRDHRQRCWHDDGHIWRSVVQQGTIRYDAKD